MEICSHRGLSPRQILIKANMKNEGKRSFNMSRLYDYLVALILISILLCGIIYAALGIKLLFGL